MDKTNIHKFVKPGARIRRAHIYLDNGNQSENWTSWTFLAGKIVIENPGPECFGDESGESDDFEKVKEAIKATQQVVPAPAAAAPAVAPVVDATLIAASPSQSIDEVLNNL